jgi:membrane fusion protein, heavy metal efflux system
MRALKRTALSFLAASAIACASCSQASPPPRDEAPAPNSGRSGLVVDARMLESIKVAAVQPRDVPTKLTIAGKVQFDEDRVSRLLAPVAGQVVDLHAKLGDVVRKGQRLCAISSREATAAIGEHVESHKDLDLAEKNMAMTEDLFAHEAASRMALQQAENDLAKSRSRVARNDEALRLLGLRDEAEMAAFTGRVPITSPIAGTVIDRKVTDGQFVQSDSTPIVTIADLSTVWIVADVFERDLRAVKTGGSAAVTTAAYPGETFLGSVSYISDSIDPATRAAKIRVAVPNPGGRLKPEMFANVALDLAETVRAITVPPRSVFIENGRSFVYVEVGGGRFERRGVELAAAAGADPRVVSGLQPGDRIVVDGALLLRQEEEKRAG